MPYVLNTLNLVQELLRSACTLCDHIFAILEKHIREYQRHRLAVPQVIWEASNQLLLMRSIFLWALSILPANPDLVFIPYDIEMGHP